MSKTTSKVLLGCGIGCGVIVVILIALGVSGYFFVKDQIKDFEGAENLSKELIAKYGTIYEFTPSEDTLKTERISTFIKIRNAMAASAEKMDSNLTQLSEQAGDMENQEDPSIGEVFNLIKNGVSSLPKLAEYLKQRNQMLLDNNMGLGEYYYFYITSYFSYLKKSPQEGPPFNINRTETASIEIHDAETSMKKKIGPEYRGLIVISNIREIMLPMLKRMAAKEFSNQQLNEAIKSEIQLLETNQSRIPWQDGLPEPWLKTFTQYKDLLDSTFYKISNPIELGEFMKQKNR